METEIPGRCPYCGEKMVVQHLKCPSCETDIEGEYLPCPVCSSNSEIRDLFEIFMKARGNLKEVQSRLGVSYPTVRNRIQEMFFELGYGSPVGDPEEVIKDLKQGEISVEEAENLLKGE